MKTEKDCKTITNLICKMNERQYNIQVEKFGVSPFDSTCFKPKKIKVIYQF